ncbi:hypothetical protein V5799_009625 [Amblyomma americanum]|uniref:Secreted protein n=1 Tax=Amblyomma americanum TaxID=6943 RepID=A0AAQ4FAA2_AMBAM
MRLTLLLHMQVFFTLGTSAVLGPTGQAMSPCLIEPFSSAASGWKLTAVSTIVDKRGSLVINVSKLHSDTDSIDCDPPIFFEYQEPRDYNQAYLNPLRFGYVGFGAGTLADMRLTLLLHMLRRIPTAAMEGNNRVAAFVLVAETGMVVGKFG